MTAAANGRQPKQRGAQWERDVAQYFREHGYAAARLYGAGRPDDRGDLTVEAWIPLLVECKAVRKPERAAWMDAARAKLRDPEIPVVVDKRFGADVGAAYVTMDLRGFVALLDEVARRSAALARAPVITAPDSALSGDGPPAPAR